MEEELVEDIKKFLREAEQFFLNASDYNAEAMKLGSQADDLLQRIKSYQAGDF